MCSLDPSQRAELLLDSLLLSNGNLMQLNPPKKKKKKEERNRRKEIDVWPVLLQCVTKTSVSPCSDLKLRVRILIDGTLIIYRVKPEDAGKYTCSPSNSLGISPSASAYLTVQCECYRGNKVEGEGRAERAVRGGEQQQQYGGCLCWRLL